MTNEEFKLFLESIREENKANFSLSRATITAEVNRIDEKLDQVIKHQEWQNGKLEKHDTAVYDFKTYSENCTANKFMKKLGKPKMWIVVAIIVFLTGFINSWLFHNIDMLKTLEKKFDIELVDTDTTKTN